MSATAHGAVLAAGMGSGTYKALLAAHILTSVVGLGGVVLNGVYASEAQRRQGPSGRAVSEANYRVSSIAEVVILLIPLTGLGLVWASDSSWSMGDTWVWASLAAMVVALALSRLVVMPGHRRINTLLGALEGFRGEGPPPQLAEVERLGKAQAAAGGALSILTIVVVALMVWKPGA